MILQNLANSSYFKVTGPLTSIQGSSANTVARNVPKATALLLYCFNTDKKIYLKSAGVAAESDLPLLQHGRYRTGQALKSGTGWEVAELGLCCCSHPAQLGWDRAVQGKEGRKLFPPLSTVQMFENTNYLQE